MLGSILIVTGAVLAIGSLLAGFFIVSLGCSMSGASGCEQSALELIVGLMTSSEGTALWAAVAVGFVMISVGYSIKSPSN